MKKQIPKIYTLEEKRKMALDHYILLSKNQSFGEPTYAYQLGDKVRMGNLKNCIIDDITTYKGVTLYGFIYEDKNGEINYMYEPWYRVRPYYEKDKDTNFTKEDKIQIRFYNSTIESLLSKFYLSGVDMNPFYQRDYVWDEKDKEALLDSIFNHIEIGKFAFIHRDYSNDIGFEILDGKQRLSTLLDFYENRLAYKGVYYNDLSFKDRLTFLDANITMGETENLSKEQIYEYFYKLNRCGKVMDESHLQMIREQITAELEENNIER